MSPLTFTPRMKKVSIYRERAPIGRIAYVSHMQRDCDFRRTKPGWVATVYMGPVLGSVSTAPYSTWREAANAIENTLKQIETFVWRQRFREDASEPRTHSPADEQPYTTRGTDPMPPWPVYPIEDDI